jgi:AraC-like DNA-binding protein
MNYVETSPIEPLARYVKCFWTLEGDGEPDENPAKRERILPDGCMEIVFNLADRFNRFNADGTVERQPMMLLVGQMRRHLFIEPTGRVSLLGVRFWPGGAYFFLSFIQDEIADRIIDLDLVWDRTAREAHSRLHDARTRDERITMIEAMLLTRLKQFRGNGEAILAATAALIRSGGGLAVEDLAGMMGISRRQLDRRFKTAVGLSPKLLARIIRFQRVFKELQRTDGIRSWAWLALECGYSDQPHLIRDFKAFAGTEPTSYFSQPNVMSDHFTGNL